MKPSTWKYILGEAGRGIKKNTLMSVAAVTTVTLSLLTLALVLLLVFNFNHLAGTLESQMQVVAYLDDNLPAPRVAELDAQIKAIEGVSEVAYVTKAEALERLKAEFGVDSDILAAVEDMNPLRDSFEIAAADPEQISAIAGQVAELAGVAEVNYGQEILELLLSLTSVIRYGGAALLVAFILATVMIIANAIRMTVVARRREVAIMKLVGATDALIRWPFLLEGVLLGLAGAVVTAALVWAGYSWVVGAMQRSLPFVPIVAEWQPILLVLALLIVGGVVIGAVGSTISIRRFLRV
ncbi:MAG TPA: ABC transporter permease [Firmicutes bacterium]|jgi:cell division transport system permease protein|nr:ABC transporter permease [Bacillota bacterium]